MKIAIHHRPISFSTRWIQYCEENGIPYKRVNCYNSNIIEQLEDCDALMWHFHQASPRDVLFAKQLMYSLQTAGKTVFPDFNTCWHFDDKVGQKYLLESVNAPLVPSYVFYDRKEALKWVENADFPKVFKLRRGSGSDHVKLIRNREEALKHIRRAFGKGYSQYDAGSNLAERWRKYKLRKTTFLDLMKGIVRLGLTTEFSKVIGNEKGYIYFQDFIGGNDHDIRVNIVNGRAFAVKRGVRENDFRASGSGFPHFEKHHFTDEVVSISFDIAQKLKMQTVAFDFLKHNGSYLISEVSYGFCDMTRKCTGYWDEDLNWHQGSFYEEDWMVEMVLNKAGIPHTL
jgi:glutathione synthase/RimK-type ligase-like ATP-grasp enzyme